MGRKSAESFPLVPASDEARNPRDRLAAVKVRLASGTEPRTPRLSAGGALEEWPGPVDLLVGVLYLLRLMFGPGEPKDATPHACWTSRWAAQAVSLVLSACGGSAPLLHSAHVLPVNTVSAGAGVSRQFASNALEATIDGGRAAAAEPLDDPDVRRRYAEGVLARSLIAPGTSPWIGARVGLPSNLEAGLTYVGRSVRLDGRYALMQEPTWAVSVGVGASALLFSPDSSAPSPQALAPASAGAEFDLNATGFGADLPLLVGYQSVGGFFEAWAGLRAGFEMLSGSLRTNSADPGSPRLDASGRQFWAGGLIGLSLGVPPVWFRFELATTAHRLSGSVEPADGGSEAFSSDVDVAAWTFAPAGALVGKF